MSVTLTLTEQAPPVQTLVLVLRPRISISDEKVITIADDLLRIQGVEVEQEKTLIENRELVLYKPEESWSITSLALSTISAPFAYTYYGACYLMGLFSAENLAFVVGLFTARGVMGTVHSTVGTVVGTFWGIQCAELISQRLIGKTIAVGCVYFGKSNLVRKFMTAGANVIVAPSVEATIIILGGVLGGEIAVVLGNMCIILAKKQKDVIAEWLQVGNKIKEID